MKYKLKIEQMFKDKYNGALYEEGEVVEFEQARGEELLADGRKLVSLAEIFTDEVMGEDDVAPVDTRKSKKQGTGRNA